MPEQNVFTTSQVVELAGITKRQLEWWVIKEYVTPSIYKGVGSGSRHKWSKADIEKLTIVSQRIYWGLTVERAFQPDYGPCPTLKHSNPVRT